jgi:hypothetical protein
LEILPKAIYVKIQYLDEKEAVIEPTLESLVHFDSSSELR